MKYFKCLNNVEFKVARNLATFCDQNAYVLSWNRLRIATLLGNIISRFKWPVLQRKKIYLATAKFTLR